MLSSVPEKYKKVLMSLVNACLNYKLTVCMANQWRISEKESMLD